MKIYDFRSDTVTLPTPQMMAAIASAKLGDAARGDDPTVRELEQRAAAMTGKEAAIFLPSGGMANLSAIIAHGAHGSEVIVEQNSHIYNSEGGGIAFVAGAIPRPVRGLDGLMSHSDIQAAIRDRYNSALAPTALICIENTHNAAGGMVVPLDNHAAIRSVASEAGIPIHLDGARLFNAATYLGISIADIAQHVDSLMFSVCKGLGGPVGAILAGDEAFVARSWRAAKMLGGGMRQAGLLAAPALVALEDPYPTHQRDHALARKLAAGIAGLDDSLVAVSKVHTNIVNCFVDKFADHSGGINAALKARGILANASRTKIRFVTHYEVDEESVVAAISAFAEVLDGLRRAA